MPFEPFLSDAQKDQLGNQFFRLHDTFARQIIIYRTAQQIVLVSNPANNYLFQDAPFNDTTQTVQVSGIFNARILYDKRQDLANFTPKDRNDATDQPNLLKEDGRTRIQVDETGRAYLFDAKNVTFDGKIFEITADDRPHGLFAPKFWSYYLTRLN